MNNQNEFFNFYVHLLLQNKQTEKNSKKYNKNIIIKGASNGIGLSTAFYFLNCNANLIIKTDLAKKYQIEILLKCVARLFNSIDIFINCAGIKLDNDIEKTYEEDFKYTINTNLSSVSIILK